MPFRNPDFPGRIFNSFAELLEARGEAKTKTLKATITGRASTKLVDQLVWLDDESDRAIALALAADVATSREEDGYMGHVTFYEFLIAEIERDLVRLGHHYEYFIKRGFEEPTHPLVKQAVDAYKHHLQMLGLTVLNQVCEEFIIETDLGDAAAE